MDILTSKHDGVDESLWDCKLPVRGLTLLKEAVGMFLVHDSIAKLDYKREGAEIVRYNIYKIQFIASCSTDSGDEIVAAFYIGEFNELVGHALSGLPEGYHPRDEALLVDYKSYLEICDFTGESKLSIAEYILKIKEEDGIINSILEVDGKLLNADQQDEY